MPPSSHPLPPAPGHHQQQQQGRPRAKSSFSFHSNHSHKSSQGSAHHDLIESHNEKESNRLQTKADPTLAMNEAEPAAVAMQKTSLAPIRSIQHRDAFGNPIADPDRSNPTRSRWERPLDTIRGFEAAIDGNYSRKSYMRTGQNAFRSKKTSCQYYADLSGAESTVSDNSQFNRRSSYYGGTQITTDDRPRYGQGGYYGGGRASSYRPESTYMQDGRGNGMTRPESYYNNGVPDGAGPSNGYYPNRARYPRTASEPHFNSGGVYPPNGNPHSYETVATASGSGGSSGEPAGYTTDPSSEDSIGPIPGRDPSETYGIGFGNVPQYAPPGSGINVSQYGPGSVPRQGDGYPNQVNGYQNQAPPAVPRKENAGPRVPIKLGSGGGTEPTVYEVPRPVPEKRKSWFGKRLSKNKN